MADEYTPPMDYAGAFANLPNPTQQFTQGLQAGAGIQQLGLQQQMQQAQFARMQQMQRAAMQVAQDPSPQNIAQLSIAFPEFSEQLKRSYDLMTPVQQRSSLQHMSEVYSAIQNGRPDIASQVLRDRASALQNTGTDPDQVRAATTMADLIDKTQGNPGFAQTLIGGHLAALMGPEKFADNFRSLMPAATKLQQAEADLKGAEAQAAPGKLAAETANLNSQAQTRAGQLALDRDKLMSETQLKLRELQLQYGNPDEYSRKLINEAALGAASGEQSAVRLGDLADRMDSVSRATGFAGTAADAWKQVTGAQDGVSALKQEYARIVNNQALGQIKDALGGRVTDVDMKVALGAVPDANASPELVTSYLRGTAKLQRLQAAMQNAQAEWLSQTGKNGHLGPAPHDLSIMGTEVPAGTTFDDFSRTFAQQKADQIAAQSALVRAQGRSYMRHAAPQAADAVSAPANGTAAPTGPAGAAAASPAEPGMLDQLMQTPVMRYLSESGIDYTLPENKAILMTRINEAKSGGRPLSDIEKMRAQQIGLLK